MPESSWTAIAIYAADLMIRVGFSMRIIMRRLPVGTSLAWLSVVLIIPFGGALIYLLLGELRLGNRRVEWAKNIHGPYDRWVEGLRRTTYVDWSKLGAECEPLNRLISSAVGIPTFPGNRLQLLDSSEAVFHALIADIDAAQRTCHAEFYIWNVGGTADDVAEAILRAAKRGVKCRVLVDAVGSHAFLRSSLAKRLREAGIGVVAALPGGLVRALFVRFDLRLHRKIVVIDGEIAYTGSLNMVDPIYFKKEAGVGQWVDAMVRLEGPAVEGLATTFLEDWELETGEGIEQVAATGDIRHLPPCGTAAVQVAPSGPLVRPEAIQEVLLTAIYAARHELVMTTPYFVPDESLRAALTSAARRGVEVTIIVPRKVDSRLVRLASQAHQGDLVLAGAHVALFSGGLLHTKSITVDGEFSLFGSLNLDPRSLHLNFEITLAIYDREFTAELHKLQQGYLDRSTMMDIAAWQSRSWTTQFVENAARLVGPLL